MKRWSLICVSVLAVCGCSQNGIPVDTNSSLLDINDWSEVHAAFAHRPGINFKQTWQESPSPNFAGGTVKMLWERDGLVVHAFLNDVDIVSSNRTFNAPFFTTDDVFEVFLRPEGQQAYFEIHVGAQNQKMQLKIDDSKSFYERRNTWPPVEELIAPYKVESPVLESNTRMVDAQDAWEVVLRIPYAFLSDEVEVESGTPLYGSFCRYDYTTGEKEPMYSSTSTLEKLDFHRQEYWDVFLP